MESTSASASNRGYLPAALYDGRSAERHEIHLLPTAAGLWIVERSELWQWPAIRPEDDDVIRLWHGDAQALIASANAPDARRILSAYLPLKARANQTVIFLGALLLAVPVVLWLAYVYLLPAGGALMARAVPLAFEERLGESAIQGFVAGAKVVREGAAWDAVESIKTRLESALDPNPYHFRITVVGSGVVNAAALPGGQMIVFSGLLEQCRSAEEFAGVLAHEMQHVLHRHGLQNLGRHAALGLVLAALGSPDTLALTLGSQLAGLKYQRSDEEEADRDGARLLIRAKVDPRPMAAFMERIAEQQGGGGVPEYFSTHPDPRGRAEKLRETAAVASVNFEPVMSESEWQAARRALRGAR